MQVDFLIVGQGVTGTFLSYYLEKENRSFLVIDDQQPNSPSRVAAGIINPITGRRLIKSWMVDELLPFAEQAYQAIGDVLGIQAIDKKDIIDIFPTPFRREAFIEEIKQNNDYLALPNDESVLNEQFQYEFGFGEIKHSMIVALDQLLPAWRKHLKNKNCLLEERFEEKKHSYINAGMTIFCDGANAASTEYFQFLPFSFNKGEALIINVPGLSRRNLYKKSLLLAPIGNADEFWSGANYQWKYEDDLPTKEFRESTEQHLKTWLKLPFTVTDHKAGIRPATIERRPFVGIHPHHPQIGILNGMGTKGCSLAPFFAKQLCDHILHNKSIHPEADVKRFTKILSK